MMVHSVAKFPVPLWLSVEASDDRNRLAPPESDSICVSSLSSRSAIPAGMLSPSAKIENSLGNLQVWQATAGELDRHLKGW